MIIDISSPTQSRLATLQQAGVTTVIRYYARETIHPEKRLTKAEALAVMAKQMSLAIVHEGSNDPAEFTVESGRADAAYARQYAAQVIGQPAGSAIYFGADFFANDPIVQAQVIPYFQGVTEAMTEGNGLPVYRIGVYGCGDTCVALQDSGVVSFTWLSAAQEHPGSPAYRASGAWILSQRLASFIGTIQVDIDDLNPTVVDFGQFSQLTD